MAVEVNVGLWATTAFLKPFQVQSLVPSLRWMPKTDLCGLIWRLLAIAHNKSALRIYILLKKNPCQGLTLEFGCKMTGLEVQTCHILEVACVVTSPNLVTIAESPPLIIHQPDQVLNSMNEWCIENHRKSGLTEASRRSTLSLQEAEHTLLQFLRAHTPQGKCPLAGNSVHYDRQFLHRYMPEVDCHLHYRIVDVSTVKELCRRWLPQVISRAPMKALSHRALDDIRESIQELRYYRSAVFSSVK